MGSQISIPTAVAVGLGAIIGAGIFVLSGTAIAIAGGYALLAFVLVGIAAIFVSIEMGELSSLMPNETGASYSFTYKAFGSEIGFITGILLFFSYATSISVISLGFGSYLSSLLGVSSTLDIPFAICLIFLLALLNILGIKKAAHADFLLVIIKVSILLLFVFAALFIAFSSHTFSTSNFSTPKENLIVAIFSASVVIFFAYSGFQTISTFASKVKGRNGASLAMVVATSISLLLYALVAFSLIALLPASSYQVSGDPLAFALKSTHAPEWILLIVDIGALVATVSATIAMILSSSRILYQISKDGLLPKPFRKYDKRRDVAVNGVLVSSIIGIVMLFSGNIYIIAAISNFGLLFSYLMTSFALIHFRRLGKVGSFKTPLYPYIPVITIIFLFAFIIGMPRTALLLGTMLIIILLAAYYMFKEVKKKEPVMVRLFD
ncbi:MAG: APC family permease [Candidatus Micrarchaeia archaeon]|jgi:APA family basic amino acid/polyamine antiporter